MPIVPAGNRPTIQLNLQGFTGWIDRHPDTCPRCHALIVPLPVYAIRRVHSTQSVEIVYTCPNNTCQRFYIAYFDPPAASTRPDAAHTFRGVLPNDPKPRSFVEIFERISPSFCSIYNEALAAEQLGLMQICGVGYRKALEFLIKDYLISLYPDKEEEIKKTFLGVCINNFVTNQNMKNVARRATWLGNDETHYVRKWVEKDVRDLKSMIDLTLAWIETEERTKQALIDMPEQG